MQTATDSDGENHRVGEGWLRIDRVGAKFVLRQLGSSESARICFAHIVYLIGTCADNFSFMLADGIVPADSDARIARFVNELAVSSDQPRLLEWVLACR